MGVSGSKMSRQVYYVSNLLGISSGVDLDTGLDVNGNPVPLATGKGYADTINLILATATKFRPVTIIFDLGLPTGKAIIGPPTGHWSTVGQGWSTGIYQLPGSNANGIQNFPGTDYATRYVWTGASGWASTSSDIHTGVTGKNVSIRNLRINGNRGFYPNGNSDGTRDGTLTGGFGSPGVRGPYEGGYWLSGIILANLDNVHIDKVFVYNAPAYHVNLYNCTKVWGDRSRIEAADPTLLSNQDGWHFNGGCADVFLSRCWISVGDDPFAFNTAEGNQVAGGNFSVNDLTLVNCLTGGRMHGPSGAGRRVSFRNIRGTSQLRGIVVGDEGEGGTGADSMHSLLFENIDINVTLATYADVSMISVCNNVGLMEVRSCKFVEQAVACPLVRVGTNGTAPTISSMVIEGCSAHRNSVASAGATLYLQESGTVGDLQVDGARLTEQYGQDYTDVGALISVTGGTLGRCSLDVSAEGAGSILTVGSGVTCGPVLLRNLVHISHGGSAHSVVNNSTNPFHLHTVSALGSGVAALTGGSGTITTTGAALVAL